MAGTPMQVLEVFGGTARHELGFRGPPVMEAIHSESRVLRCKDDLDKFCESIQTHGYVGVKGPAGRVEVGSKLQNAASAWKYDWKDSCVVMAIQEGWSVAINSVVRESASTVTVDCQRSVCQMESGLGGYSAVVVQGCIPEACDVRFNYRF